MNCPICHRPNRAHAHFCAYCGAPLHLQNKYRITRLLGRGGYSAVYEAEHSGLGNARFAIKELFHEANATLAQRQAASDQFRFEASTLAKLNDEMLPKVMDFFTERGRDYLVMEYVPGDTLQEYLARSATPLPEAQVLKWADELCDALMYLHAQIPPVIHRDIKPSNIKITPDGKIKLLDFGIAKLLSAGTGTGTAARAVTAPYAPLEQYGRGTDARSDIYALGVTMYELLTKQLPPEAPDRANQAVIPPRQHNPAISLTTEAIVLKAMAEKQAERFASARELRNALRGNWRPQPLAPVPPPAPALAHYSATGVNSTSTRGNVTMPWWILAAAGGVGLFLIILIVLLTVGRANNWLVALVPTETRTLTPTLTATLAPSFTPTFTSTATNTPTATRTATPELPVLAGTALPPPVAAISLNNVTRLEQIARWGKGTLNDVAWSPQGDVIAAASSLGVYLLDPQTLLEIALLETDAVVSAVAFSPDGATIAAGTENKKIVLFDLQARQVNGTLLGHANGINDLVFSNDGTLLASSSWDDTVKLWTIPGGRERHTFRFDDLEGISVPSVAFSPDGRSLLVGLDQYSRRGDVTTRDGFVRGFDTTNMELLFTLSDHTSRVTSVGYSPNGEVFASGSADRTVKVWSTRGALLQTLNVESNVYSVAFSPDGSMVAVGLGDNSAQIWRVADGTRIRSLNGHTDSVAHLSFAPDGNALVTEGFDDTLRVWDLTDGRERLRAGEFGSRNSVVFAPDQEWLAFGAADGSVHLVDVQNGADRFVMRGHSGGVSSLAVSPDGKLLASASYDRSIFLWATNSGREQKSWQGHEETIYTAAFAPDGKMLATGGWDKMIKLWEVPTGRELAKFTGHDELIYQLEFSPDGKLLASASWDETIKLWNVANGTLVSTLTGHTADANAVAFSPDGILLATGADDQTIRLWNVTSGSELAVLNGHTGLVLDLCFSEDGLLLFSTSSDNSIKIWDVRQRRELMSLVGHISGVNSIALSPDERWLASSSWDGTVRLWGVR